VVSADIYHQSAFSSNAALLATGRRYFGVSSDFITGNLNNTNLNRSFATISVALASKRRHAIGFQTKYHSIGSISLIGGRGFSDPNTNLKEVVTQLNYTTWFPMGLSIGLAVKYAYSNMSSNVRGYRNELKGPTQAFATDLGFNYRKHYQKNELIGLGYSVGLGLNNIGTKLYYRTDDKKDFIPTNMMLVVQLNLAVKHKQFRLEHDLSYQITKLLVPTPPEYGNRYLDYTLPWSHGEDSLFNPNNANPNYGRVIAGQDPQCWNVPRNFSIIFRYPWWRKGRMGRGGPSSSTRIPIYYRRHFHDCFPRRFLLQEHDKRRSNILYSGWCNRGGGIPVGYGRVYSSAAARFVAKSGIYRTQLQNETR